MTGATFKCPSCGKIYVNRADIAGGKVTCECGHLVDAPEFAGASQEAYDFVEEWNPAAKKKPTVAKPCPTPPPDEEVPDYSQPKKETLNDRYGPRQEVAYRRRGESDAAFERAMHERASHMWMSLAIVAAIILGIIVWGITRPKPPPAPPMRADDQEVVDAINDGSTEAVEWLKEGKKHAVLGWSNGQALGHVQTWYSLGAVKVLAFGEGIAGSFAIELPADPKKRAALFAWETDYAHETHQKPVADTGQKYLVIEMKF